MEHPHTVFMLKITAAGEIHQLFRATVAVAAVRLIVIGQPVGRDILDIGLQGGGIAHVPIRGRHCHRIRAAELQRQFKDGCVKGSHGSHGVPIVQQFRMQRLQGQHGLRRYSFNLRVRILSPKCLQKRVRQFAGAGLRPSLTDAAVNK